MESQAPAPPPSFTDRDPLGTRHKLSNLIMVAAGLEEEATDPSDKIRIFSVKVAAMGALAVTDVLGSMLIELRQWRDWSTRRGPKKAP